MMTLRIKDIFSYFKIENNQLNYIAIKSSLIAMARSGMAKYGQKVIFDEKKFNNLWIIYNKLLQHFDVNYNRKSDFISLFQCLINSIYNNEPLNLFALFCPGYTRDGYKNYLGNTTIWKLKELYEIKQTLAKFNIRVDVISYYSDVFLENYNSKLNPNWSDELQINKELFHKEGEKYFNKKKVKNVSDLKFFCKKKDVKGYVLDELLKKVNPKTYIIFQKNNNKFYKSLGFSEKEIKYRNDKLVTMYIMLSNYINTLNNTIFLPMENMYERENIFSENGTCTMYLRLKR